MRKGSDNKMAKKSNEPQYITSPLNTPMTNYKVYVMNAQEKLVTFLIAFLAGGIAGLTFYGGQFRDADGLATTATSISNFVIFVIVGIIACIVYFPMRTQQLKEKRRNELKLQFRSLLQAIAVSLSSGMNMLDSLNSACNDLKTEYSENAHIVREVKEMLAGIQHNIPIEVMMKSFGKRSEIDDIVNFGTVFEMCYRSGGNMKDVVMRTNSIISEKMEIAGEIETSLASNKTQFSAMMVIPVVMVLLLRVMSSSFAASFSTVPGVIAITVAIGMFYIAYKLGQKIMDIKG